ncbi:MAG: hypothetical protein DRJ10_02285 [Bacteroidetes bacterium]|nr:MAG: hypothetical protein DRJ10_02285 [Bacteroidota bacterium]
MNNKDKLSNKRPVLVKIVNIVTSKLLIQYSKRYKKDNFTNGQLFGSEFINSALKELKLDYHIGDDDLKRIPEKGPFITVSNHPLGGLDALLVIKIISSIRPEYGIPALLKKYIKLNTNLIGFNVDPKFNNLLDGLIILDIFDTEMME